MISEKYNYFNWVKRFLVKDRNSSKLDNALLLKNKTKHEIDVARDLQTHCFAKGRVT